MIIIPTPTVTYASSKVSLSGQTYTFTFRFNSVAQRWFLDIDLDSIPVIHGQMLIEGVPLFYGKPIKNFDHGLLLLLRNNDVGGTVGRNNLGIDKEFSLVYITNEEWENVGS